MDVVITFSNPPEKNTRNVRHVDNAQLTGICNAFPVSGDTIVTGENIEWKVELDFTRIIIAGIGVTMQWQIQDFP